MADLGWEDDEVTWGGVELSSKDFAPVFLAGSEFFILGGDSTVAQNVELERRAIIYGGGGIVIGRAVYPQILGPNGQDIQISLGAHDTPEGAITWEGPYNFTIDEDDFVDFDIAGKYLAIRFASSIIPVWTLQAYIVDYTISGVH